MDFPIAFPNSTAGCIIILGILSHLLYFIKGEHHLYSMRYFQLAVMFPVCASFVLWNFLHQDLIKVATVVTRYEALYICSVWLSMLIYRVSPLHRLSRFPGPVVWKLTKFTQCWKNRHFFGFKVLDDLHHTYGEYVRTGPSELSITDPDAVAVINGANSKCIRSAWYNMADPLRSMFETRDRAEHDKRRRVWDQGFSTKALRNYEPRVDGFAAEFERQIAASQGKPMNISEWSNYFSFDVVGDLAYGKPFDMLREGTSHFVVRLLANGQKGLGIFGCVPWLFLIITKIPVLNYEYKAFLAWCEEQLLRRQKMEVDPPDILSWLLQADPMTSDEKEAHMWLSGDSRDLIVAGSNAVAAVLTFACYHLARDPTCMTKVREELAPLQDSTGAFNGRTLQIHAPYLNAFLNEIMRLHPPNASGSLRQSPPEGIWIGERFIPGDVVLCVPHWTLNRSSKSYVDPNVFIPERWTTKPELLLRKDAFIPFGMGPYGCVGKQLALMELRLLLARIVMRFDVAFAPGETGRALLEETRDYFTLGLADFQVEFKPVH